MKWLTWMLISVWAVLPMLGLPVLGEPLPADDARFKALGDEKNGKCLKVSDELAALGSPAVPELVKLLKDDQKTLGKMADHTLIRLSAQKAGTDDRGAVVEALARALGDARLPVASRNKICRYLSYCGESDASVRALALAMDDADVQAMAIWALARIPSREAVLTLLKPLMKAEPDVQVLLLSALKINLAAPQVQGAVGSCFDLIQRGDASVQPLALDVLSQMPYSNAVKAIGQLMEQQHPGASRAMLKLAETLIASNQRGVAVEAVTPVEKLSDLTVAEQCHLIYVQSLLGTDEAQAAVLAAINSKNPRLRAAALDGAARIPGPRATGALGLMMATIT